LKLQQDIHELEAKLRHMMVVQVHEQGGSALEARLQALEAENASIRSQLTEAMSSRNLEFCTLSSKLDHKEYELHQVMKGHEQSSEESQRQIVCLQDEVCKRQEHIRDLEQKLAGLEAANEHHLERIDRLNDYMGHMPSMEEHQALEAQDREMRVQCEKLANHLKEKEAALKNALDELNAKDLLAQSLEGVKRELEDTRLKLESHKQSLAVMEPENRKFKQECKRLQKVVVETERRCRQELQAMRERHRARFLDATAKLRSQYKNLAKRARALETQLTRNSDAMMALNSELQFSQGTIGTLKTSMKDLVSQNQGLLEKNLSLQESSAEALKVSQSLTEAQSSAAQQLGIELSQCVEEFESLVSLSMSLLEGQEPTPAMLFGPDGHAMSSDFDCGLESRLGQVKHLRGKIEELRTIISEHFAAQLSSACNVQ
jgi:chromosome segregation ATPase